MPRKLRELRPEDYERLSPGCAGCVFWESAGERQRRCGAVCDVDMQRAWLRNVTDSWGSCGRVAYEEDELLGFIKYAPAGYFPQASTFLAAPRDSAVPLIACLHVDPDVLHHGLGGVLMRSALKDLLSRGERRVEAIAHHAPSEDSDGLPMLSVAFLERHGFTVERPDPLYPLMRLDLRSLATWTTDNLENVLESLKFPVRVPSHAPATLIKGD